MGKLVFLEIFKKILKIFTPALELRNPLKITVNNIYEICSGQQMQEISNFTFAYEAFPEAMGMLWKRMLQENRQV